MSFEKVFVVCSFDNRNGALELAEHGAVPPRRSSPGRYFFLMSAAGLPLPPSGPRADYHNREQTQVSLYSRTILELEPEIKVLSA